MTSVISVFLPKTSVFNVCHIRRTHQCRQLHTEKRFRENQNKKEETRTVTMTDKLRAKTDRVFQVSTFNLQAFCQFHAFYLGGARGDLYRKGKWKWSCYNLLLYSLVGGSAQCWLRDESQSEHNSCDIGTCLYHNINSIASAVSPVETISLYSDTCDGQNQNQFTSAAVNDILISLPILKFIN